MEEAYGTYRGVEVSSPKQIGDAWNGLCCPRDEPNIRNYWIGKKASGSCFGANSMVDVELPAAEAAVQALAKKGWTALIVGTFALAAAYRLTPLSGRAALLIGGGGVAVGMILFQRYGRVAKAELKQVQQTMTFRIKEHVNLLETLAEKKPVTGTTCLQLTEGTGGHGLIRDGQPTQKFKNLSEVLQTWVRAWAPSNQELLDQVTALPITVISNLNPRAIEDID